MVKIIFKVALFFALISCSDSDDRKIGSNPAFDNLKPYVATGPYAADIIRCVKVRYYSNSCNLTELPLISMDGSQPTIDEIMNHVVVSHTWMGDRMRALLEIMPNDILLMLRSTTAIVIDDSIRPSFFTLATGAIYIDPAFLWLTNDEKAVISKHDDFRKNFGNDLQFKAMKRYVINNQDAWQNFSLDGTEERLLDDILINSSRLFFHELAHTSDCMLPVILAGADASKSYYGNIAAVGNYHCYQDDLYLSSHLHSNVWMNLALVLYHGYYSTSSQRALTASDVGNEFATDVASESYSFSSSWEDFAMLVEATLMKKNFNADMDVAFIPNYDVFDCNTALIKWGQRGRIGDLDVFPRAQIATDLVLPEVDLATFYATIPAPLQIPIDTSYCVLDYSQPLGSSKDPLTSGEANKQIENALGYE